MVVRGLSPWLVDAATRDLVFLLGSTGGAKV